MWSFALFVYRMVLGESSDRALTLLGLKMHRNREKIVEAQPITCAHIAGTPAFIISVSATPRIYKSFFN